MYGKTQYMAQLVEPLEQVSPNDPKDPSNDDDKNPNNDDNNNDDVDGDDDEEEEEDQVEVRWTHNGVFEWVPLASVRVHETATVGRRESLRKSPNPKSPLGVNDENPTPLPPPRSSKKRTATEAVVDEEQAPTTDDAKNKSEDKAVGTTQPDASTEPPAKKQKTGYALPSLFSTLTTKVGTVKKSFVAGCQEIYKELLGPSS
jgi:hypothetical protein